MYVCAYGSQNIKLFKDFTLLSDHWLPWVVKKANIIVFIEMLTEVIEICLQGASFVDYHREV